MALSLRGTAENSAIDGADVTVTHPGGIATNDVVYVAYAVGHNTSDFDMQVSTAGYSELADLYANDALDGQLGVFRKVQGATPDSTVVCVGTTASTGSAAAVEHVWTGADTTTPEDATTTTATGIDSGVVDSPAITTVTANAIVLSTGSNANADTTVTAPSGYGNQVDIEGNDSSDCVVMMASIAVVSPAEEDPPAWQDLTTSSFQSWCAATVAIRPAAAAGGLFRGSMLLLGVGI
jgi:hypothetical protein